MVSDQLHRSISLTIFSKGIKSLRNYLCTGKLEIHCLYISVCQRNCLGNVDAVVDCKRTESFKLRNSFSIFIPMMHPFSLKIMTCCCDSEVQKSGKLSVNFSVTPSIMSQNQILFSLIIISRLDLHLQY